MFLNITKVGTFPIPSKPIDTSTNKAQAKCAHAQTGRPISKGTCFKKAFLIAITLGVVSLLCTECCGLDSSSNGAEAGAGNVGGGPQMDQMGGGFVQQPQPTYQPQMNWTPVSDAAADGIQG